MVSAANLLVSVVIPSFNRTEVVERAIDSVLKQSYEHVEVIVVDDGSEDGPQLEELVAQKRDPRLRLIRHETNLGGGAARNTGVEAAHGILVAFLDSDDEWDPGKLEYQVEVMKGMDSSRVVSFTQSIVVTQEVGSLKRSVMPFRAPIRGESIGDYLFVGRGWLQTSSIMVSREVALQVPFNPTLRRHQDYDLLLRLESKGCRFEMVPRALVIVHWEDMHSTSRGLNPRSSLAFVEQYGEFLSCKAVSGFVCQQIVSRLLRDRRRLEAFVIFVKRVRIWHLSPVRQVCLWSEFFFGDARLAKIGVEFKSKLRRLLRV